MFTRALSTNLADKEIRVNGVARGPIWTPLIPSTFPKEKVDKFGKDTPMGRPRQPEEVAPCFVFLAAMTRRTSPVRCSTRMVVNW
jgi:NAD(P)-dependent dehydrogenase (short-subunit alcohol dehydrogenase family)